MEEIIRRMLPLLIMFGVMFVVWILFRSKASKLASISELDARIGQGNAVVLEFFSNT